ncbi:hypothetical protein [Mucilaginibacter segetis]|uniref:DoxX family protein n=1 Tax=Mucilaginibacter segetis TaxID=2793071 RepID=A0A934PS57_9SPHI|nr:hypothetical protein [Mucilaginibacter segetis]MBK0378435.1 hypothetical protein [Mucilaginibacter segetis]
MNVNLKLDNWHAKAKANRWLRYFTVFNRLALAAGFLPAGIVKIMGERFASGLSVNHPMGHYLEALHLTGYYYPFIGVVQILAAILLLVPRTATLGAIIYFPVILNICVLSFAVRFDGSLLTSPLMVLANMYLLCWDYDKLKYIFLYKKTIPQSQLHVQPVLNNKFPVAFFAGVALCIAVLVLVITHVFDIMPHNNLADCELQCGNNRYPDACHVFCNDIHKRGKSLGESLNEYHKAIKSTTLHK